MTVLRQIQNDLFDVGADLCTPVSQSGEPTLRVEAEYILRLEEQCDIFNARLEPLRSFILPGGTPGAACSTWPHGGTPGGAYDVGGRS